MLRLLANNDKETVRPVKISATSLIYSKKSVGLNTLPWGTPLTTEADAETYSFLFERTNYDPAKRLYQVEEITVNAIMILVYVVICYDIQYQTLSKN